MLTLRREKDLQVIDVLTDSEEALRAAIEQRPDVVIMDAAMPGMDGIQATKKLKEASPETHVVMVSGDEEEYTLARAVQAGASDFLKKTDAVTDVATSVRKAVRGESTLDEEAVEAALRQFRHRREQEESMETRLDRLTRRELEVLQHMADGKNNEAIAVALSISVHTVRTHSQKILTKLGVHSKIEAVVEAIRHGKVETARIP